MYIGHLKWCKCSIYILVSNKYIEKGIHAKVGYCNRIILEVTKVCNLSAPSECLGYYSIGKVGYFINHCKRKRASDQWEREGVTLEKQQKQQNANQDNRMIVHNRMFSIHAWDMVACTRTLEGVQGDCLCMSGLEPRPMDIYILLVVG